MVKKYAFIAGIALSTTALLGQVSQYRFSQRVGVAYASLQNETVLATVANGSDLDNGIYTQALPFSFSFNGQNYSEVHIFTDGFITFGSHVPSENNYSPKPLLSTMPRDAHDGVIAAFSDDLKGMDFNGRTGKIAYNVSGTAPNRVFAIEWTNFVFNDGEDTIPDDRFEMQFQIRLHENGIIEKSYNISVVGTLTDDEERGIGVGLKGGSSSDIALRKSTGTMGSHWDSTIAGASRFDQVALTQHSVPASGLTFIWSPNTLSTKEIAKNTPSVEVYPNPAHDVVYFKTKGGIQQVSIFDASGKLVFAGKENSVRVGHLPKGTYFVKIEQDNGKLTNAKFVKK